MQNLKIPFKNKKLLIIILLGFIIFVAAVLRLYQLGSVPVSPDWDEAALGYNAYSILETGKDEYGKSFPIILQSFADYKPALYMYLAIPSVAMFGLDTFAVRLPSAIFGILTVLATYFLVLELFKRRDIALVSAFLLAISPWHIQFSRVAFEANVGVALNVFGLLFFLKGLKKPWLLSLSAAIFGLSLYIYQSQKVFTPLFILLLIVIFRKEFFAVAKKYLVTAFIVGIFVALPMVNLIVTDKQALARAKGVSIFSVETPTSKIEKQKYLEDKNNNNHIDAFQHHRYVTYGKEVLSGYFAHFDIKWLFIKGDLERHHAPNIGLLYLWELPFLLVGIYLLLFGPFLRQTKLLIFLWFLLVPIPASITFDVPHAVRTINFLPIFQIFIALGIISAYQFIIENKKTKQFTFVYLPLVIIYSLFIIFNFLYYLNQYFVQQNYYYSQFWQYGYKEAVDYVKQNEKNYKKIIIASETPLDQSYIFFLFYLKYPPQDYQHKQDKVDTLSGNFEDKHIFSKFEFRPFSWDGEKDQRNILFIGRPQDFPPGVSKKQINYLDGTPAIIFADR